MNLLIYILRRMLFIVNIWSLVIAMDRRPLYAIQAWSTAIVRKIPIERFIDRHINPNQSVKMNGVYNDKH